MNERQEEGVPAGVASTQARRGTSGCVASTQGPGKGLRPVERARRAQGRWLRPVGRARTSEEVAQLEAGDALALLKQLDGADLVHLPPLQHSNQ